MTWRCLAVWPWPEAPSSCTQQPSCSTSGGQSGTPYRCSPDFSPCHSLPLPPFLSLSFGPCRLLLLNQFHDVVTGSCIQLVAEDAMNYYEGEAHLRTSPSALGACSPMPNPSLFRHPFSWQYTAQCCSRGLVCWGARSRGPPYYQHAALETY